MNRLRHFLQIGAYHTTPRYLNLGAFLNFACGQYAMPVSSREELEGFFSHAKSAEFLKSAVNQSEYYTRLLVQEDLIDIGKYLNRASAEELSLYFDAKLHVAKSADIAESFLRPIFPDYVAPTLRFVDRLPAPYQDQQHFAMNIDQGDFVNYGAEPGVYILNHQLRPIYTAYLYLHELGHVILGRRSPEGVAFGIEEGICELLGSFFLSYKIFPSNVVRNLYLFNRHFGSGDRHWEYYRHNTRVLAPLLMRHGWDFVFSIMSKGRDELKKVEDSIYEGHWNVPNIREFLSPSDRFEYVDQVLRSILADNDTYIVSPLAYLVARFVFSGMTVRELIAAVRTVAPGAKEEEVNQGLDELSKKFGLLALRSDGSVVTYSDCNRALRFPGLLRYEI